MKATRSGRTNQNGNSRVAGAADSKLASKSASKFADIEAPHAVPGPKVMVAFSAGLDSTVLLHLCALFFGSESVLAVHVNHGLQAAAKSFEAQARRTCREWGIRLVIKRLKGAPAKGDSIEAWARSARYQVLDEVAQKFGIEHVFTAHHQDDQLETLLIALARGAGLDGLRGIAPNRLFGQATSTGSMRLHRPLLDCPRSALKLYAEEHDLQWVEDPSNRDPRFLRNRIRLQLIPALQGTFPGFAHQASRSMAHLREAASRLEFQLTRPQATQSPHSPIAMRTISRSSLQALAEAEQVAHLRSWLRNHDLKVPSQAKLAEIRKQLLDSKGGSVSVPHGCKTLRRERDRLWVEEGSPGSMIRIGPSIASALDTRSLERTPQGWIWPLPEFRGSLLIKARLMEGGREKGGAAASEAEEVHLTALKVTAPRSAQKMHLELNTPRKTLKNLFQAAGIPAALRKRLPCVTHGEEVLFVAGLGTAHRSPWKFEFLPDL